MLTKRGFIVSAFVLAPACIDVGRLREPAFEDGEFGGAAGSGEDSPTVGGARSAPKQETGGERATDSSAGGMGRTNVGGSASDTAGGGSPPKTGGAGSQGTSTGGLDGRDPFLPPEMKHKPIDAGWFHTCIVIDGGSVQCWGNNAYGQLGDGSNVASNRPEPTPVAELWGVTKIAAGARHSCALLETGKVRCWGAGDSGQLGTGPDLSTTFVPKEVIGVERAIDIGAGYYSNCALLESGQILCWGSDSDGQLGNNVLLPDRTNPPTLVDGIESATAIAVGGKHACARLNDGTAKCWGWNEYGQVGSGKVAARARSTPDVVLGLEGVVSLAAGVHNTCAILEDGSLWCWGYDGSGALGDGNAERVDTAFVPVQVPGLTGVLDVSIGEYHVCALLAAGEVKCWGANDWGQVGDATVGHAIKREGPTLTEVGFPVQALAIGGFHSCARGQSGEVACWGHNEYGSVGSGSTEWDRVLLPTRVKGY